MGVGVEGGGVSGISVETEGGAGEEGISSNFRIASTMKKGRSGGGEGEREEEESEEEEGEGEEEEEEEVRACSLRFLDRLPFRLKLGVEIFLEKRNNRSFSTSSSFLSGRIIREGGGGL